ncbi:hypothetical protein PR202_gb26397 [Eleusine coracana subsp. coracana]|uniref:Uncharacterized protein n=1 Tax=Eleusine coracana subsp. coracana TaxID=191504 RepID=A0AAV5FT56_ELECO|nr:hypothetical protein PR202_gb26397 [Eleusine coracana subsp. coracana]
MLGRGDNGGPRHNLSLTETIVLEVFGCAGDGAAAGCDDRRRRWRGIVAKSVQKLDAGYYVCRRDAKNALLEAPLPLPSSSSPPPVRLLLRRRRPTAGSSGARAAAAPWAATTTPPR